MERKEYFVIYCSEDGDVSVNHLSKSELLKRIEDYYWGDVNFTSDIPDSDPQSWGNNIVIIKGSITVPHAVTQVTKYDIK